MNTRLFSALLVFLCCCLGGGNVKSLTTERLLTEPGHGLEIRLNVPHNAHRFRRTTFNISRFMWTHRIPYVIGFKDQNPERALRLRKVLDHIQDNLCVKFYDVGATPHRSDVNWLKKHGYKTNAYISFQTGKGCVSRYGIGNGKGAKKVSPCFGFGSLRHETMHTLGAIHEQKMPGREKYISVHYSNIRASKKSQYLKSPKSRVNAAFFDPASNLLYTSTTFNIGNRPTYHVLRPDMKKERLYGISSVKTLFYEMNQNYKCKETFCSKVDKDCGPGYLTFVHDKCVCMCPDQYDPDTGCTTLKDRVEGPSSWPNTPFTLYKAGLCPDGFEQGVIPLSGKKTPEQTDSPFPLAVTGKTLNIEVCTKTMTTSRSDNISWSDWPLGSYCIGKVSGVPCDVPFKQTSFKMTTAGSKPIQGSAGDVTTDGRHVTMRFCCKDKGPDKFPAKLPTTTAFRLVMTKGGCQEVDGMFAVETKIETQMKTKVYGLKPKIDARRSSFKHYSCLYIPPVYGCNKIFKLDADQRTVKFSIPKNGSFREGSRRCFYAFQAPPKSRFRLTFNTFNIHPNDKFLVKRFHPWTNPFLVKSNSHPTQIITERNYLFVEFWSYYEENKKYKGADLTVDILLDKEMCYDADRRGSDYSGDKSVSELYEQCVPWKEATSCDDFPWKFSLTLLNSGNKCRNLDKVEMLQPWCYIKVEGAACARRYCDVCNEADSIDLSEDCDKKIKADPKSCSDTTFKNRCFKTCGADQAIYDQTKVTCSKPKAQKSMKFQKNLQDSFTVGATVDVSCGKHKTQIQCTTQGWTHFGDKCTNTACIDSSQLCQRTLKNFPSFCTHEKSKGIAKAFCAKSCALC